LTSQAETQSTQQNWPAAATEWKKAADQFGLLNDLPRQAIALHNQGQAEQEQSHMDAALRLFESAAALNQKTAQTAEWWRNQIALLQVEAGLSNRAPELERRFQELASRAKDLHDPSIHGLFQNELGLSNMAKKQWAKAEASFLAAEKDFAESKNATGTAAAQGNRALLAEATDKFATAESLWRSALSQFEKLAQPTGIARSLAGIGRSLLGQQQNLAEAEDLLRRAAENFRLLKLDAERKKALEALSAVPGTEGRDN
jgi:tetratricopeptide (TPR) repeat protein